MRLIGVLASGETPTGTEASDALMILQDLIDSWQIQRLMLFTLKIQDFPLTPGQQTYTCGAGGDFDIPRPALEIKQASIVNLANPAQPLELPMEMVDDEEWQGIPVKAVSSTLPLYGYDDGAYPFRNISFYPVPQVPANWRPYIPQALTTWPDLSTTDVLMPPGYRKAIRYNLAVDLMPEFPGNPATFGQVMEIARETKAWVKISNAIEVHSGVDTALVDPDGGAYDWRSDLPVGGTR